MDGHYLTPAFERLQIDEVLHLHNLWRLGPPRNPSSNRPPRHPPKPLSLKQDKRFKKRGDKKEKDNHHAGDPSPSGGLEIEWPCPPPPIPRDPDAGWGEPMRPKPVEPLPRAPPSEADQAQHEAIKASKNFFSINCTSDDDEDDGMEEDEGGSKAFEFFLGLFERDSELRGYYERNGERGEFSCLVCSGIGVKAWKRFGSCVGLVQHTMAIARTKRREAHRALARVVCRVLGWDIDRFPNIVLDSRESLGQSLASASNQQALSPQKEGVINEKEVLHKDLIEIVGTVSGNVEDCSVDMEISSPQDDMTGQAGVQLAADTNHGR